MRSYHVCRHSERIECCPIHVCVDRQRAPECSRRYRRRIRQQVQRDAQQRIAGVQFFSGFSVLSVLATLPGPLPFHSVSVCRGRPVWGQTYSRREASCVLPAPPSFLVLFLPSLALHFRSRSPSSLSFGLLFGCRLVLLPLHPSARRARRSLRGLLSACFFSRTDECSSLCRVKSRMTHRECRRNRLRCSLCAGQKLCLLFRSLPLLSPLP